jgi:hypothetical protein
MTIARGMTSQRVEWFLQAKRTLRAHPEFTDEQVAERCNIPAAVMGEVIPPARREIEQDGLDIATQHARGDAR